MSGFDSRYHVDYACSNCGAIVRRTQKFRQPAPSMLVDDRGYPAQHPCENCGLDVTFYKVGTGKP